MAAPTYVAMVPVRWSDMDALGHVNNVQMVRLLEEARIAALREWFDRRGGIHRPHLLVARQEIDYLAQLRYHHDPVAIEVWVTAIAGASFDLGYRVHASGDPDSPVVAAAETTLVVFDPETQRPVRVDEASREVLHRWRGEPVELKRRPAGHR